MHSAAAGTHELARAAAVRALAAERVAVPKAIRAVEDDREDVDAAVWVQLETLVAHVRQAQRAADRAEWAT